MASQGDRLQHLSLVTRTVMSAIASSSASASSTTTSTSTLTPPPFWQRSAAPSAAEGSPRNRGSDLIDTTWLFSPECSVADPRAYSSPAAVRTCSCTVLPALYCVSCQVTAKDGAAWQSVASRTEY